VISVRRSVGFGAPLLLTLLLCGCGTPPGPPPITSLGNRGCAPAPDLAAARPVFLSAQQPATADVDAAAPCVTTSDGARAAYQVFGLPDAPTPYLVTVASEPQGQTLFAPRVMILDGNGATQQELPREAFMFHGTKLSVAFRTHGTERFVVVLSDPSSIGTQVSQMKSGVQATAVPAGPVIFFAHTGFESSSVYTYAHNGRVTVSAQPIPTVN
jgi:hypothetical protein